MPRYYFDLPQEHDEFGSELPDDAAAQLLARRYAGELLRDGRATDQPYWRMDVRQGSGPVLFSLVLELVGAPPAWRGGVRGARPTRHADDQYI